MIYLVGHFTKNPLEISTNPFSVSHLLVISPLMPSALELLPPPRRHYQLPILAHRRRVDMPSWNGGESNEEWLAI
jgi:hypothetical protein